jgi:hypothetical protein
MKKQGVKRVNQTSGYVISKLTDQRIFAVHFKNTIMTMATSLGAKPKVNTPENYKGIENHRKSAEHLEKAAKLHLEAARHHESGEHGKAAKSTIAAQGHVLIAAEAQREDVRHHAMEV